VIAEFEGVAKWYGRVIGLVDVTVGIEPGVTGLLGPNGAGKSTFLKLLTGQLAPSQGTVRLKGEDPFRTPSLMRGVGFQPEQDAFYDDLTGRDFVIYLTRLQGYAMREARIRADRAIARVALTDVSGRTIRTYSKGMRQRIKLAQAIAHDPDVLILDEPLGGMDPIARRRTMDLVAEMADGGTTVIVSSHVLHEVEAMTRHVLLLHQGMALAWGDMDEIRATLGRYPHKILVRSRDSRAFARAALGLDGVVGAQVEEGAVHVQTTNLDEFYESLPRFVVEQELHVEAVESEDVSLNAIFDYLVS